MDLRRHCRKFCGHPFDFLLCEKTLRQSGCGEEIGGIFGARLPSESGGTAGILRLSRGRERCVSLHRRIFKNRHYRQARGNHSWVAKPSGMESVSRQSFAGNASVAERQSVHDPPLLPQRSDLDGGSVQINTSINRAWGDCGWGDTRDVGRCLERDLIHLA